MEQDNDKTRTHIVLTKGTMVSHCRIIEKIGAGLLLYYKVRRFSCNSKACNSAKKPLLPPKSKKLVIFLELLSILRRIDKCLYDMAD